MTGKKLTATEAVMTLQKMKAAMKESLTALGHTFILVNDGEHKIINPEDVIYHKPDAGVIYALNSKLVKDMEIDWVADYADKAYKSKLTHWGMDLSMKPSFNAVMLSQLESDVASISDKYYDEETFKKAFAQRGMKLLEVDYEKLVTHYEVRIGVNVQMPQGGTRVMWKKFDQGQLQEGFPNAHARMAFVMQEMVTEMAQYASEVTGDAQGNDRAECADELRKGLTKLMCDTHDEFVKATSAAHVLITAQIPHFLGEHYALDWTEKLRMRGLRAEYTYVELWTNEPLVQLRGQFRAQTKYFGTANKGVVVEFFGTEKELDEIMTVAVYLLNDRGTEVLRAHTGL